MIAATVVSGVTLPGPACAILHNPSEHWFRHRQKQLLGRASCTVGNDDHNPVARHRLAVRFLLSTPRHARTQTISPLVSWWKRVPATPPNSDRREDLRRSATLLETLKKSTIMQGDCETPWRRGKLMGSRNIHPDVIQQDGEFHNNPKRAASLHGGCVMHLCLCNQPFHSWGPSKGLLCCCRSFSMLSSTRASST